MDEFVESVNGKRERAGTPVSVTLTLVDEGMEDDIS